MLKRKVVETFSAILLLTILLVSVAPTVAASSSSSTSAQGTPVSGIMIVKLKDPALAEYAPANPSPGNRLDLSTPTAQAYLKQLSDKQAQFENYIKANNLNVQVLYHYSVLLNGLAVKLTNEVPNRLIANGAVLSLSNAQSYQTDMDISPNLVGLTDFSFSTDLGLWAALGGHQNAGLGMKIGIIDTGIDQTHPFLTDSSLAVPAAFPKCDALDSATSTPDNSCLFTSNKVIVAKVFQSAYGTSFTAFAAQAHGTHVSGTAAGVFGTTAPLSGARVLSGIAPKAFLGNYNVFPDGITNSFDVDIIAALEAAFTDGMDVVNLSLGGSPSAVDPLADAANAAADAGMIPVIAAGNSGSGAFTIQSPGVAKKAITAGASTNAHFFGIKVAVTAPTPVPSSLTNIGAAVGEGPAYSGITSALYFNWDAVTGSSIFSQACTLTGTEPSLTGMIALIRRGGCFFSTKINNAASKGAIGVIISNNAAGDPTAMSMASPTTIPAVMVSITAGVALRSFYNTNPTTATLSVDASGGITEFFSGNQDFIAGFSSRGPTLFPEEAFLIKPDVTAPGVNVYSSVPGGFAIFQGTSMATPHTAGAAALLKQLHPSWSVQQVKSALVNSAARPPNLATSILARGGGRIDLIAAAGVTATLDPASISFGLIEPKADTNTEDVEISSVSTSTVTYTITGSTVLHVFSTTSADGPTSQVTLSVSKSSLTLAPGADASFKVTLTTVAGVTEGFYQGDIILTASGAPTLRIPILVLIFAQP